MAKNSHTREKRIEARKNLMIDVFEATKNGYVKLAPIFNRITPEGKKVRISNKYNLTNDLTPNLFKKAGYLEADPSNKGYGKWVGGMPTEADSINFGDFISKYKNRGNTVIEKVTRVTTETAPVTSIEKVYWKDEEAYPEFKKQFTKSREDQRLIVLRHLNAAYGSKDAPRTLKNLYTKEEENENHILITINVCDQYTPKTTLIVTKELCEVLNYLEKTGNLYRWITRKPDDEMVDEVCEYANYRNYRNSPKHKAFLANKKKVADLPKVPVAKKTFVITKEVESDGVVDYSEEVKILQGEIKELKRKNDNQAITINTFYVDNNELRDDNVGLRNDNNELRVDNNGLRADIVGLRVDNEQLRKDIKFNEVYAKATNIFNDNVVSLKEIYSSNGTDANRKTLLKGIEENHQ